MSVTTSLAPSSASSTAAALPRPMPAPVTKATLPATRFTKSESLQWLAQPLAVEALEIGLEIVDDGIAWRSRFHFVHGAALRADELADFHPLRIGDIAVGIDLAQRFLGVAHDDRGPELPVLAIVAEGMAALALGHTFIAALADEEVIGDRQQDRVVPADAILQHRDIFEEAVVVLVGAHDAARLRPWQRARDQIGNDFLAVRGHGLAPGMKIDLASTFQKSLKSLVKRDDSLMALAYIFFTSGAKSAFSTRLRSVAIHSETGLAWASRLARISAR